VPKIIKFGQCFTELFKKITLAQFILRHDAVCDRYNECSADFVLFFDDMTLK